MDADVVCLQETKLQPDQIALELPGYRLFWNSAEKKGYSGTAVFTRVEPLSVTCGIGLDAHDHEGRVITAEFDGFFLVCCYTPNAQNELARIDYRMQWEDDFRAYLMELDKKKPVAVSYTHLVAGKVVKYRRNVTLEPMNAYERHVIHTALQETPDITTYSIGTEPNRRTVVAYSRGEHR